MYLLSQKYHSQNGNGDGIHGIDQRCQGGVQKICSHDLAAYGDKVSQGAHDQNIFPVLFFQFLGPILYFVIGREEQ